MDEARLKQILGAFPRLRIAVVGDFFLDKLLLIDPALDEPSLETGLPAWQVTGKRISPGAAGTVMNNLAALTIGRLYAVGVRGDDGEGYELEQGLRARGVDTRRLSVCPGLFTPTYIKPLFLKDGGLTEGSRLDVRNRAPLPRAVEDRVVENLWAAAEEADAVIALDQVVERNTGVVTDRVRAELAELGCQRPGLVLFADSRAFTLAFRNVIVKCNQYEAARAALGVTGEPDDAVLLASLQAMTQNSGRPVFITCGARGICTLKDGALRVTPSIPVEGPIDICGAGDAATAGLVSALTAGALPEEAALVANLTASITIGQIGTTGTASPEQILERFRASRRSPGQ